MEEKFINDELLQNYLDKSLSERENKQVAVSLEQDPLLRARYLELLQVHNALKRQRLLEPTIAFTANVMKGINPASTAAMFSLRQSLLLLSVILLGSLIATVLIAAGMFDNALTTIDFNELTNTSFQLPQYALDLKVVVNGVIFLNLGLALILLDRAILRPYFMRRWQSR